MNVLLLGVPPFSLAPIITASGCTVTKTEDIVTPEFLQKYSIEFAVSYRYRHIVRKPVIEQLDGQIINLHISLLPWNRGADPNLWSFLEDTPKGVTIHYLDEGLDTGDIIAQREMFFDDPGETLASSYEKLNDAIIKLFAEQWPLLVNGEASRCKQPTGGSLHRAKDKEVFSHLLAEHGWDTPVRSLIGKGLPQVC